MCNHEGYSDPTADAVVGRIARMERKRRTGSGAAVRKSGSPAKPVRKEPKFNPPYFTRKYPLPIVYISSPFAGDGEETVARDPAEDRKRAKRFCRFAVSRYCVPVAPRLLYPGFLRDDVKSERSIGIYCGMCLLEKCAELWVFGDELTNDMEWEIWRAYMRNIKIRWFTEDLKEFERPLPEACRTLTGPVKKKTKMEKGDMHHE